MKKKEDLTKKSDNNSEDEESKRQDEGSVQKVQRMDNTKVQKKLEKMAQWGKANEKSIGQKEPSEYEPQPSKKIHTEDDNDLRIIQYLEYQVSKNNIQEGVIERLSPNFFNKDALTLESRLTDDLKFYAHCSMCLENLNKNGPDFYLSSKEYLEQYSSKEKSFFIKKIKNSLSTNYFDEIDQNKKLAEESTMSSIVAFYVIGANDQNIMNIISNNKSYYQEVHGILDIALGQDISKELVGMINDYYIDIE